MIKLIHTLFTGLVELPQQMRWTYLPPLMVYLAAGISGLTAIVGTFFIKDYLNLSAAFLASTARNCSRCLYAGAQISATNSS